MPVLGTDTPDPCSLVFHGLERSAKTVLRQSNSSFNLVLNITLLPRHVTFRQSDSFAKPTRKRHEQLPCVAARTGVVQEYKPVSLSGFPIKVTLRTD